MNATPYFFSQQRHIDELKKDMEMIECDGEYAEIVHFGATFRIAFSYTCDITPDYENCYSSARGEYQQQAEQPDVDLRVSISTIHLAHDDHKKGLQTEILRDQKEEILYKAIDQFLESHLIEVELKKAMEAA